jgi:hypothetical protein
MISRRDLIQLQAKIHRLEELLTQFMASDAAKRRAARQRTSAVTRDAKPEDPAELGREIARKYNPHYSTKSPY